MMESKGGHSPAFAFLWLLSCLLDVIVNIFHPTFSSATGFFIAFPSQFSYIVSMPISNVQTDSEFNENDN
jgi:hypothetical protein